MNELHGRVWKFGNNVDTDAIVPGRYLDAPDDEIDAHVLENLRPEFPLEVTAGDIIVAGRNFGCGSSREHAPLALKRMGIACVAAESFARIFFRNAIAIGLPVLICKEVTAGFEDARTARISMERFQIFNTDTGANFQGETLSEDMIHILKKGGIIECLKEISAKGP